MWLRSSEKIRKLFFGNLKSWLLRRLVVWFGITYHYFFIHYVKWRNLKTYDEEPVNKCKKIGILDENFCLEYFENLYNTTENMTLLKTETIGRDCLVLINAKSWIFNKIIDKHMENQYQLPLHTVTCLWENFKKDSQHFYATNLPRAASWAVYEQDSPFAPSVLNLTRPCYDWLETANNKEGSKLLSLDILPKNYRQPV